MTIEWDYICSMFILAFGLATLGSGLFTAYFGAGKSRTIGVVLTIVGVVFVGLFYYLPWQSETFAPELVKDAFMATFGAAIGVAIAVVVILGVLMKVDTPEDLEDLDLDDLEDIDLDEELRKLEAELESEEKDGDSDEDVEGEELTEESEPEETGTAEADDPPADEPEDDDEKAKEGS